MALTTSYQEKELLHLISQGDEQAFGQLFYQYIPLLQPYLLDMLKSRQAVEDAIQNTFIRIWLQRDKLPEVEYPRTWITRIAVNECLNILRRKKTEKAVLHKLQETASLSSASETDIQFNQTKQLVQQAIDLLSPQRKKIYEMSRLQGRSVSEIAEELGLSVQTVKNTLGISLDQIRGHLKKNGITLPAVIFWAFLDFF
ncbi:sigma-70 family RNA polymerase sigma factor [Pseudoflavitalea sp. G-6-1-2]|uniref:RNA polymerase sigma factor n=1 Tax=Pseudoflavitalea sp. G-6-1-2 TaxID=2728841 RepID=UPI00146F048D|nr:sigma-70 family RNA polymerase sigma factor [Pseudoflavitalea sp. G-6-1-2]NML22775.1 sigma-70 family RNA polymerase sigma factor [Pseudoflavitalea sp. G-6-1-2]